MACQINIDGIIGFRPASETNPHRIVISGTAIDCGQVEVKLKHASTGVEALPQTVNVDSDTASWLAEFTIAEGAFNSGDFVCGTDSGVEVDVVCTEGGTCHADQKREDLPCQVEGVCPLAEKIRADAPGPSVNFCNLDQTRTVSVVTNVTPANASDVVVVQWTYQPIDPPGDLIYGNTELVTTAGQEVADSIDLAAGLYTCTLEIITPVPCPGPSAAFTVDPCPGPDGTPPEACPGINFDDINVGDCTNADERTVAVHAVVTPTAGTVVDAELILVPAGTVVEADTALGSADVLDSATGQTSEFNLSGDRDLPPGDYTTYVRITSHGYCTPPGVDIVVASCPPDDDTPPGGGDDDTPPDDDDEDDTPPGGGGNGGGTGTGEDDDDDDDDVTENGGGGINWCLIALITLLVFLGVGAVLLGVALCLIGIITEGYSTVVLVVIAVIGAVILVLATIFLIIWIFTCGSCRLNCWLLDLLIDVLLFLGAIGIILTLLGGVLLLLGISKFCWLGWLIDTADFGLLALLAYWFSRVVGCRRWPRWVPGWARLSLPDRWRRLCGD